MRSHGAMIFVLQDGLAEGRWVGRSGGGALAGGHAALAGAPEEARAAVVRLAAA